MSLRYRKRPIEVEAFQMTDANRQAPSGWPEWLRDAFAMPDVQPGALIELAGALLLQTLEGVMAVSPGDWIIRGVNGELYPCKPDIFDLTYEAVTSSPPLRLCNCPVCQDKRLSTIGPPSVVGVR